MEALIMNKGYPVLFSMALVCLVVFGFGGYAEAASMKGSVAAITKDGTPVCTAVKELLPHRTGDPCAAGGPAPALVGIAGAIPKNIAPEQTVILKASGTGKVMATVVGVVTPETPLDEVAPGVTKGKADVLWRAEGEGPCLLLRAEKPLAVSVGDTVKMKVKSSSKRRIEGC
jgi:hypothetical protein